MLLFLTYLAACATAAATGVLFPTGEWYRGLTKPGFTPPNRAFPIIWTTLYVLMAWAAARVAGQAGAGFALGLWSVQIALNTLWTPVFFGLKRMRAGLVIIGLLWLAILATTVAFFAVDLWAGVLLLPYLAWVSVACALNHALIRLNPSERGNARGA